MYLPTMGTRWVVAEAGGTPPGTPPTQGSGCETRDFRALCLHPPPGPAPGSPGQPPSALAPNSGGGPVSNPGRRDAQNQLTEHESLPRSSVQTEGGSAGKTLWGKGRRTVPTTLRGFPRTRGPQRRKKQVRGRAGGA